MDSGGASDVLINGKPAMRVGNDSAGGVIGGPGAKDVLVGGAVLSLVGDKVAGHGKSKHAKPTIASGSGNVFAAPGAASPASKGDGAPMSMSNTFAGSGAPVFRPRKLYVNTKFSKQKNDRQHGRTNLPIRVPPELRPLLVYLSGLSNKELERILSDALSNPVYAIRGLRAFDREQSLGSRSVFLKWSRDDGIFAGAATGQPGRDLVQYFASGKGGMLTYTEDTELGRAIANDRRLISITEGLAADFGDQLRSGTSIDDVQVRGELRHRLDYFNFNNNVALDWLDALTGLADRGAQQRLQARSDVGGIQGLEIDVVRQVQLPDGSYRMTLRYTIEDVFGVDTGDFYNPALIAFGILQYRREGYVPFINRFIVEKTIRVVPARPWP